MRNEKGRERKREKREKRDKVFLENFVKKEIKVMSQLYSR